MFSTVLVLIFFGIIAAILIKPEKLTEAEKREERADSGALLCAAGGSGYRGHRRRFLRDGQTGQGG